MRCCYVAPMLLYMSVRMAGVRGLYVCAPPTARPRLHAPLQHAYHCARSPLRPSLAAVAVAVDRTLWQVILDYMQARIDRFKVVSHRVVVLAAQETARLLAVERRRIRALEEKSHDLERRGPSARPPWVDPGHELK